MGFHLHFILPQTQEHCQHSNDCGWFRDQPCPRDGVPTSELPFIVPAVSLHHLSLLTKFHCSPILTGLGT